jgi:hypothetical protein
MRKKYYITIQTDIRMIKVSWPYVVLIVIVCVAIGFYVRSSREGFQTTIPGGASAPGSTTCNLLTAAKERFVDALNKAQSENDSTRVKIMQAGLDGMNEELTKLGC